MTLDERVTRYLEKCPPAVSGSDGHGTTFRVACALVNGFALDEDAALRHLTAYNAACSPAWKPKELRHKVQQAAKVAHAKPRGHLLGGPENRRPEAVQRCATPVPVRLTPKKERFRTLRTFLFNTHIYAREKEVPSHIYSRCENAASEASENAEAASPDTAGTATGIPAGPSLDWTALNAEHPLTTEDEAWRAVEAGGFGAEPLVALAFDIFGPGCRVLETEGAS